MHPQHRLCPRHLPTSAIPTTTPALSGHQLRDILGNPISSRTMHLPLGGLNQSCSSLVNYIVAFIIALVEDCRWCKVFKMAGLNLLLTRLSRQFPAQLEHWSTCIDTFSPTLHVWNASILLSTSTGKACHQNCIMSSGAEQSSKLVAAELLIHTRES